MLKSVEFHREDNGEFIYRGELDSTDLVYPKMDGKTSFRIPYDNKLPREIWGKEISSKLFEFRTKEELPYIGRIYTPLTIARMLIPEPSTDSKDYLYAIIFAEGDNWSPKRLPIHPDDLESYLKSPDNIYKGETLIQYRWDIGNNIVMICRSIMFPDGRIWDGSKGSFRGESKTINF